MANVAGNVISDNSGHGISCGSGSQTITNNTISSNSRDGIYIAGSSPMIANNEISDNNGSGVWCNNYSATVVGNVIKGNRDSGMVFYTNSFPIVVRNVIADNTARSGGGVYCRSAIWVFDGNTIAQNSAEQYGGGIYLTNGSVTVENCIVSGNTAPVGPEIAMIATPYATTLDVKYSNVTGGRENVHVGGSCLLNWGPGNLATEPLFADLDNGDYHLKSKGGRWDSSADDGAGGWLTDGETSPCVDAGDRLSAYLKEPQPNGGRVNMGAYGNTAEASKAPWTLTVKSTPISGVSITGDLPGITDYSASGSQQTVDLIAPASVTVQGARYDFLRWVVGDVEQPDGATAIQIVMDRDYTATAVYGGAHTLTVLSAPIVGVNIDGGAPGATPYAATGNDGGAVTLTAPSNLWVDGTSYSFIYWFVDNQSQGKGQASIQVTMDSDHTAVALYDWNWRLAGDNNDDCVVNILDLLFVRNRLQTTCSE